MNSSVTMSVKPFLMFPGWVVYSVFPTHFVCTSVKSWQLHYNFIFCMSQNERSLGQIFFCDLDIPNSQHSRWSISKQTVKVFVKEDQQWMFSPLVSLLSFVAMHAQRAGIQDPGRSQGAPVPCFYYHKGGWLSDIWVCSHVLWGGD